jgi:hypothetical protein
MKIVDNSYYKNSKKRKENIRITHVKNVEFLKKYINRLKENNVCAKCGDARDYVLEFHHTNKSLKENNISILVKGCSMKKLKEEIIKCILICANCHKEIHYFQRINMKM